mgnify:CR=1 FL=1
MSAPIRVVFVCLGNICRSPLAEGAFREHVRNAQLNEHFAIDSAGTSGFHAGESPDRRSIEVASRHGVNIGGQRSRVFVSKDLDRFDYVIAMDRSNQGNIERLVSEHPRAQISLMLDEVSGDPTDVPDPYYGGAGGFENVWQLVNRSTKALLVRILDERGPL